MKEVYREVEVVAVVLEETEPDLDMYLGKVQTGIPVDIVSDQIAERDTVVQEDLSEETMADMAGKEAEAAVEVVAGIQKIQMAGSMIPEAAATRSGRVEAATGSGRLEEVMEMGLVEKVPQLGLVGAVTETEAEGLMGIVVVDLKLRVAEVAFPHMKVAAVVERVAGEVIRNILLEQGDEGT